jgi:hypothetical protein
VDSQILSFALVILNLIGAFTDDDFMYYNNVTTEFHEFMGGPYSVILKYTGLRWLGKSKASFVHNNEKDYIFLSNAFLCHLFPDAN